MKEQVAVGRLGQRAWLLRNMPTFLGEAVYHRAHHDEESEGLMTIWHWGEEEGQLNVVASA
jgi:hypothetical protein